MQSVRHAYTVVEGVRLHWAELGEDSAAPAIVLLHGLNDSHLTWARIAPELASGRRVLMPDLPGCGLSDRPDASYALSWHAEIIAKWLVSIGVLSIDLIGHSFGGGVGQMLLLERALRVRRLVLLAPGGLGRDVGIWLRLAAFPSVVELFGQPLMAAGTRLALRGVRQHVSQEYLEQLSQMNASAGTARAFARTVRDVIDLRGQRRHFLDRAHEVESLPPVAVWWGDRDDIIPMTHGKSFVQSVEGALFRCFEGAGHYLHHEQPVAVCQALREFLDDCVWRVRSHVWIPRSLRCSSACASASHVSRSGAAKPSPSPPCRLRRRSPSPRLRVSWCSRGSNRLGLRPRVHVCAKRSCVHRTRRVQAWRDFGQLESASSVSHRARSSRRQEDSRAARSFPRRACHAIEA
jgi:pimeloyl-ACP methyl ester carboxylesterase